MTPAAFAIPGDLTTVSGGYIYERRLLEGLRAEGRDVAHLELPAGFPDPTQAAMATAIAALQAVPPERPLIVDGLVFGAVPPAAMVLVRAPMVAMIHHPLALESGLPAKFARHLYDTEQANCALAAHVVVPSPNTKRVLAADYGVPEDRISIALPGIDRPAGPRWPRVPPLILSVGILHPRKGHDVLIAALRGIADLDWQAVIVGQDWHAAHARALRSQAVESGLGDRLRLAGLISQEALQGLWRGASVFALATRYEGYGIVFAEALAAGLPIVGTSVGAVPETVAGSGALLVPPDDPVALSAALRRVLEDRALRDRLAGASAEAGARLPSWAGTAAVMGRALDAVARNPA